MFNVVYLQSFKKICQPVLFSGHLKKQLHLLYEYVGNCLFSHFEANSILKKTTIKTTIPKNEIGDK